MKDSAFKISALCKVKNEETWAFASLESIKDFVDEIIVVDNCSTDNTVQEIKRFIKKYPDINIKFFNYNFDVQKGEATLADVFNCTLKLCTKPWVLKWDLDRVACTSGEHSIFQLKDIMRKEGVPIKFHFVDLWGDLEHYTSKEPTDVEIWLWPQDEFMGYRMGSEEGWEIPIPRDPNIRKFYLKKCLGIHCQGVKPAEQLLFRYYTYWNQYKQNGGTLGFRGYLVEKFNLQDDDKSILEFANRFTDNECKAHLKKYTGEWCPYPPQLEEMRKNPRFKVIYENGKIVGRVDLKEPKELILIK